MNFKVGDKAEFIYRNKKSVGEINGVYPGTQEVSIKQSDSPVDLLFSDKAVVKVEEQERIVVLECIKINQPVYVQKEASERRAASSAKKEFAKELQNLINDHKGNLSKATVLNYIEQIEDVGIGIYS